jgi:chromate reductase
MSRGLRHERHKKIITSQKIMDQNIKIVGIVGSLRKDSYNRSLMNAVKDAVPAGVTLEVLELENFPLFNQDIETTNYPKDAQTLKDKIAAADGVIIVTPEYCRSIPGVLKNAIDWTTRPYGTSPWSGKHVATMGATAGALGTAVAQSHLRQILVYLDTHVMGQPEFYLGEITKKIDASGAITDPATKDHIAKFWEAFLAQIRGGNA